MSSFRSHEYVARWQGTVPWRLVMGACALVITLSAFVVAPFMPGGSSPDPAARAGQNLGASRTAADTVTGAKDADASSWAPQAATYGTGALRDLSVTMSDGTVLRADVHFPTTAGTTGRLAAGDDHDGRHAAALPHAGSGA